ncbi:LTA synthase family protein [Hymenobacter amundsenii]|uniref:hypothetical protein n=1 Tax=Hymenobacter amundsenii TaxID=2006685 RepID=UPI0013FD21F3|nr:hypothetical protein [Hymenobacter amundsenii]
MRNRFAFQPRYFLFWLIYFGVARALFLLYYLPRTLALPAGTIPRIFGYGLRLDASAAAYLCLAPFLLFGLGSLAGPRFGLDKALRYLTGALVALVALLTVADLALYGPWGFRLDATPLQYLSTPGEAAASASSGVLGLLLGLWLGLMGVGWGLYKGLVGRLPALPPAFGRGRAALVGLLYLALLVVPLRGACSRFPSTRATYTFRGCPTPTTRP